VFEEPLDALPRGFHPLSKFSPARRAL
jgi:hypothetical protein